MELLLAVLLVSIIAGGFGSLLIWQTRLYVQTTERNHNTARLMDAQLLMVKVLRSLSPLDLDESDGTQIASGATGIPPSRQYFTFDTAKKQLLWEGTPILDQVVGTFSFNGQTTAGAGGADWRNNWATGVVTIDLVTTGVNPEPLRMLVHPRKQ
jgi:hypothetical protein